MKLFLLLFSCSLYLSAQQIDFPQDTVARNHLFNNREFAAFDSEGNVHVSYTGQLDTDGATREIYYAYDAGDGNFTTVNITGNTVDDNYSTLSLDDNNRVHIGYTGRDGTGLFQIKYLTNYGGSFGSPVEITTGGLNKATPYSKIGPDSIMHFVYFTYTNDPDQTYYRSYNLKTSVLSPVVTLAGAETGGDYDAALDVDLNGKVHIVVKSGGVFGGPLKYYNNTGGTISEVPTGVGANVTNPKVAIDKFNKVHIVYRDEADKRLYYINNTTGGFSAPAAITPAGQRPASYQNISIDDSLRVYVTYQSSVSTSGKGFYLVYGKDGAFSDTMKVYEITSEYLLRNSSAVIARGNGEIALFYAPSAMRNGNVVCDIFLKRGSLFDPIPVELKMFTATASGMDVTLNWTTATELNNMGFYIERKNSSIDEQSWERLGFTEGSGTTAEVKHYSYRDRLPGYGKYAYRLVQTDFNGTAKTYGGVEVEAEQGEMSFELSQNYPNPFNPSTIIRFQTPEDGIVTLKVYDVLGREIKTLVNEFKTKGRYEAVFDASGLAGGLYIYNLTSGSFKSTRKMTLIK